jgi:hypothetical protein
MCPIGDLEPGLRVRTTYVVLVSGLRPAASVVQFHADYRDKPRLEDSDLTIYSSGLVVRELCTAQIA